MTMATKLGRAVLYNEELHWIKSQNLLNTWPCKVTGQTKYVKALLPQELWWLNLTRWRVTITQTHTTL